MSQMLLTHCNSCGLPVDQRTMEDCPRCHYPVNPDKEERFLQSAISDLQRVANYGGANMRVAELLRHYELRLQTVRQLKAFTVVAVTPGPVTAPSPVAPIVAQPSMPEVREAAIPAPSIPPALALAVAEPSEVVTPHLSAASVGKSPEMAAPRPPVLPVVRPAGEAPARQPIVSVRQPVPAAPVQESPSIREVVFSWAAFFVDNAITIIGLLGAFLILLGTLSFVYSNAMAQSSHRLGSFLVVFGAHAIFGILGVIAYRFPGFRLIARIYIVIYALLLPLAGFTGYSLILGHLITLPVPILIVIAAAYATIVYGLLAVYQGSVPFGYLGATALAVVDLAMAEALGLGYQWWPSMLMILALPALVTVAPSPSGSIGERVFAGRLVVLREPIRIFMFILVGVCALGILLTTSYSFMFDGFGGSVIEIRFSILSMTLLLLLWTSLYFWLTRRTKQVLVLVSLSLASVLAFCYAFNFEHVGYALALTGAALLYHGLSRFAGRLLQPFDKLGLRLDTLALLLVAGVPLISEPALLLRLLSQNFFNNYYGLPSPTVWETVGELIAIGASLALTLSVAFSRAGLQSTSGSRRNRWPWLLLLSGVFLNSEYSVVLLALQVPPVWGFLGLTLALMAGTVVVRLRFGSYWANPLDLLVTASAIFTLTLSLGQVDSIWSLLLLFAVLSYGMLLYQRRPKMLVLPFISALLALLTLALVPRLQVILLLGIGLPLIAVAVRRFMPTMLGTSPAAVSTHWPIIIGWEWPLLVIALLSGIIVSSFGVVSSASTVHTWLGMPFPVAVELATFSLTWYTSAALARIKWWLLPTIGFAIAALLLPANPFWVLVGVTFVSAALALGVSRFAGREWAAPLSIVTLLAAVMTGIAGHTQDHLLLATTWVLLAFAVLVYIMGVVEDWTPWLWITPVFAIWSLVDSAVLLGDLFRPPTVVLICAAAGVAIGVLKLFAVRRNRFVRYVLPFYTTAFVAAVLTGIYGTLAGVNNPFPGAAPVTLLVYAVVAYGVVLFERRPWWLALAAGFATWGILLAIGTASYAVLGIEMTPASDVLTIGIALGVVGLLLSRVVKLPALNTAMSVAGYDLVKFSWGWPWYVAALVATIVTGVLASLPMAAWALLGFAVLFYIIGVMEDQMSWLWLAPALITWSRIDALLGNDLYGLFAVTLVSVALGVGIGVLKRFAPAFSNSARGNRLSMYALPFYVTALVSAVLTGIDGMLFGINQPFAGAIPAVLLLYAALACTVLLFESRPWWLGLVAGFAIWGTLLTLQTASYSVFGIEMTPAYTVLVIGIVVAIVGLVLSRVVRLPAQHAIMSVAGYDLVKFSWGWPWYVTALVAAIVTGVLASLPVAAWALLIFAVLAYIIGALEDFALCLWIAPVLATWSLVDSALERDLVRLLTIALVCAAAGLATGVLNRIMPSFFASAQGNRRLRYALPFYVTALVAAMLTGIVVTFSSIHPVFAGAFPAVLLLYAVAAYTLLLFEHRPWWLGLVAGFAIWGTLLALQTSVYYVFGIGIAAGIAGLLLGRVLKQTSTVTPPFIQMIVKFSWGWPWYVTALVAAIVTGVSASLPVAAWTLLVFAVLAYVIGMMEDVALCLWLFPALATWSLINSVWQPDFSRLPTVALVCAVIGVALSSLKRFVPQFKDSALGNRLLRYTLPFYAVALVAALLTGIDGMLFGLNQSFYGVMLVPGTVPMALLLYAAVAYGASLFERVPEALVVPVGLAAWAIGQTQMALWQLMGVYSLLCVLFFGSQFVWKVIPPATNWLPAALLHRIFGLGGQALVVLAIILQGGPFADSGPLAHVGAGTLLVLAVLLFWYGRMPGTVVVQRWCAYSAGALLSLAVPWELLAFRQTNLDLLTLAPASYLVVIGPFLMREAGLPHHRRIGQVVSMLGAALLLLPTLWLSFSSGNNGNMLYTLILLGESLVLLVLGLGLRVRVLVLCGAGLIVVGALHALFLSTSSTPLALAGLGVILLLVATGLTLARRRLQAAWKGWQ